MKGDPAMKDAPKGLRPIRLPDPLLENQVKTSPIPIYV